VPPSQTERLETLFPASSTPRSRRPRQHVARGIAIGLVLVGVTTLPRFAFADAIGHATPFLLYFGPIMVAAWYGGLAAGLVTSLTAAVIGDVLFVPVDPLASESIIRFGVFLVEGVVISVVTARLWQAQQRLSGTAQRDAATAAHLDQVLEHSGDAITVQDRTGAVVYANQRAAAMSGFSSPHALMSATAAEIIARFELFDPDGKPIALADLPGRSVLAGGPAVERTIVWRDRATGEQRWSELRATPVRDGEDTTFAVNVFRDVTEQRHFAEQARVGHEWFQTVLRSIGDAVIATDAEGRIRFLNPIAEQLTGWSTANATGRRLADVFVIVDEDTHQPASCPVERVLRDGSVVGLAKHTVLIRRDSSELAIDDSAAPIRGGDGELVGVVLVFRDVSAARRDEQRRTFLARASTELASSLDYQTTLATVARLAVPAIADWAAVDVLEDGELRRLGIAHIDPEKIKLVAEIERRYPPDRSSPTGTHEVIRSGKPVLIPHITHAMIDARARDAEHKRLLDELELRSYIAVPLRTRDATLGAFTMAMAESRRHYDETDLELADALAGRAAVAIDNARLYRVAEQARESAEIASRAKDEFLAMLGHELRNPLAPIVTALELLDIRGETALQKERAVIERQVRHLVRLVDDLLDVSRITRGRIALEKEPVELRDVVTTAVETTSPLIAQRHHELDVDVPPGLIVDADPVRLGQILTNLLTNAAKYTEPRGTIAIKGGRDGGFVTLAVRDTGIGIAPAMLPRIFDLFVQETQAIDRAQGGLGLGLAIVKSLVTLHGGEVTAHSDGPGTGTELRVRIPASRELAPRPRPSRVTPRA
jgi:PAS domain S-box-containing protein